MKKVAILTVILIGMSMPFLGAFESNYFEGRLGVMLPWSISGGFLGGAALGFNVDQVVSFNGSLDYFGASYTGNIKATNTSTISVEDVTNKTTANLLMLMLNTRINIPYVIADVVQPYVQVGVGYEFMFNNYATTSDNQTYVFGNFGIRLNAGAQIKLGERSYLLADVGYNFCGVTRSSGPNDKLIVGQTIDVSGFSLLAGIGFKY